MIASTNPGTVKSKNEKGVSPIPMSAEFTKRLEPEPISVVMPPKMAANESGIIKRLAGQSKRSAMACMMGMKITTTGMLLRNPLTTNTVISTAITASHWRAPQLPKIKRATTSSTPVRTMPWPITSNASTVISAELAKPDSRTSGDRLLGTPISVITGKK